MSALSTMSIIHNYKTNGGSITLLLNDNYYDVHLNTTSSYYYCINDCGLRKCYCKDKDWMQGTWDGELLMYNSDKVFAENLYNFLKVNFKKIAFLNRKDLSKWIRINFYEYIKTYYSVKINNILSYLRNMKEYGIFSKEFYELVSMQFEEKHKSILELSIKKEYDSELNKECIFIDDQLYFIIDYNISDEANKILSLQELSFNKIEQIFHLHKLIIDLQDDLFREEINIDDISYEKIIKYAKIMMEYNQFHEFYTNYEIYTKNNLIELEIDLYDISDILDELSDIHDKWYNMLSNCYY